MSKQQSRVSPLARVEMEALEAGREWTRHKIERDLQKLADKQGEFPPLNQPTVDPDTTSSDPSDH